MPIEYIVHVPCVTEAEFSRLVKQQVRSAMRGHIRSDALNEDVGTANKRRNVANAIKAVIFNDPATIVFWRDGTKTIVKADGEEFDKEKGLAMAISKKCLGNNGSYYEVFRKWIG